MSEQCSTCRFSRIKHSEWWDQAKDAWVPAEDRQCRARPPGQGTSNWPHVREDDWCGEFKATS